MFMLCCDVLNKQQKREGQTEEAGHSVHTAVALHRTSGNTLLLCLTLITKKDTALLRRVV